MYEVELGDVKVTIGNTLRIEYFGQEVPALVLPFDRRILLNGAKVFSPVDIKIMFPTFKYVVWFDEYGIEYEVNSGQHQPVRAFVKPGFEQFRGFFDFKQELSMVEQVDVHECYLHVKFKKPFIVQGIRKLNKMNLEIQNYAYRKMLKCFMLSSEWFVADVDELSYVFFNVLWPVYWSYDGEINWSSEIFEYVVYDKSAKASKQFETPTKELCIFPAFPSSYPITDTELVFFIKSALKFV